MSAEALIAAHQRGVDVDLVLDKSNATARQSAIAGDINLRAQIGHVRIKLDAVYRSLEFILQNQPSLVPFQAFPTQDGYFVLESR